jgi:hypothetical protein
MSIQEIIYIIVGALGLIFGCAQWFMRYRQSKKEKQRWTNLDNSIKDHVMREKQRQGKVKDEILSIGNDSERVNAIIRELEQSNSKYEQGEAETFDNKTQRRQSRRERMLIGLGCGIAGMFIGGIAISALFTFSARY